MTKGLVSVCGALYLLSAFAVGGTGTVSVAVASNFSAPMQEIEQAFEARHDVNVALSFGSSGKLYAQIRQGAPFDVFLSADQEKPALLDEQGMAVAGTRHTYAIGRLVLVAADTGSDLSPLLRLQRGEFQRLAIANPRHAPYGMAAIQTLQAMGLEQVSKTRLITGENIAQAFQFLVSGNAQLGLVAASQVRRGGAFADLPQWPVPEDNHLPIRQDMMLLGRAASNASARQLVEFFMRGDADPILLAHGYRLPIKAQGTHHR